MKNVKRALFVTGAAAAVLIGASTGAYAGADGVSSVTGSWSRFISYGDKFENCDTADDWMTSYVEYQYVRIDGSLQTGTHRNPGNSGDCFSWDHNFGEGRTVWFRSCVDQPLVADRCDIWRTATA